MENLSMTAIVEQDDAKSEELQDNIFRACKEMRALAEDATYVTSAAAIEMVRLAVFMLNKVEEVDGIQELIHPDDVDLKASVWGQILMCNTVETMTVDHKGYLLAVAEHMGPDWLEWLRRDVAFMIRVEGFN